jgi:hypothetical protein
MQWLFDPSNHVQEVPQTIAGSSSIVKHEKERTRKSKMEKPYPGDSMSQDQHHHFLIEHGMHYLLLRCYYLDKNKFGKLRAPISPTYLPELKTALAWLGLDQDFVDSYVAITTREEGLDRWLCIGCEYHSNKKMYILTGNYNFNRHTLSCAFRGLDDGAVEDKKIIVMKDYQTVAQGSTYLHLFELCRKVPEGFVFAGDNVPDWSAFATHCKESEVEATDVEGWNALRAAFVVARACYSQVDDYDAYCRGIRDQQLKKLEGTESRQDSGEEINSLDLQTNDRPTKKTKKAESLKRK